MGNKIIRTVRRLALIIMIVCLILIGQSYYQSARHRAQQEELKAAVEVAKTQYQAENGSALKDDTAVMAVYDIYNISATEDSGHISGIGESRTILEQYAALYQENSDLIGWIAIEGTKIDYSVMQNEDDEYYLHHDFYGEDSKYGCLYVRGRADIDNGTNFIIYGHNMKDGSMFGDLDLYLSEDFYKEHSLISFDTLYEEREYEIIAVFRSQVYNNDETVFKYYQFYEADTREEFEDFYDNIKELSLYDTGVEAQYGDTFLTLSTCAYHVADGRLVVVAKRMK